MVQSAGVRLSEGAHDNKIGAQSTLSRTLISGNEFDGVLITGRGTDNNIVQGCFIGTDARGLSGVANGLAGVRIDSGARGNRIGGQGPAGRNLISGNEFDGVLITGGGSDNNLVQNNRIGTDRSGDDDLANLLHGVDVQGGQGNIIGAPGRAAISGRAGGVAEGNIIAFNRNDGVHIGSGADGISIRGNSIFENGALGINLVGRDLSNGVTLNDSGDRDTGPNTLQNFPVISGVSLAKSGLTFTTTLRGTLNSTPNADFTLDFYRTERGDASGFGEGRFYLGNTTVRTDVAGNAKFAFNATGNLIGAYFSSTATSRSGGTSEFGRAPLQIAGFTPASGPVGTSVTIHGAGFEGITAVFFNGIQSTFSVDAREHITAIVPSGATTGPIRVLAGRSEATDATDFQVLSRPANDLFARAQILRGAIAFGTVQGTTIRATRESGRARSRRQSRHAFDLVSLHGARDRRCDLRYRGQRLRYAARGLYRLSGECADAYRQR